VSLDAKRCWVDAWAFEHGLDLAEKADDRRQSLRLAEQALSLYQGDFLSADDAPESTPLRDRLRLRFMRQVSETAGCYEAAGDWKQALSYFQRGLAADALSEGFYRGLMRCYAALGERAGALETYHRCKRHLSITLGVKPAAATEALYQQILGG
jgi:two-component SAPR family response regulator